MARRKVTLEGILRMLDDVGEMLFPMSKYQAWKNLHDPKVMCLEDYFPSEVKRKINQLRSKGLVRVMEDSDKWTVSITDEGKHELYKCDLDNFVPKQGEWDGKWRVVFFDVEEIDKKVRDKLRFYIKKLGMHQLQKSVWISPFDIKREVEYIRGLLKIPYDVRIGIMEDIEYAGELKKWFKI